MTSALTRRTRWLLVAGAVVVALLVNVAWVTFGPEGAGAPSRAESIGSVLETTWEQHGTPVRRVSCEQFRGSWSCAIEPERGAAAVSCALGTAPPELLVDPAELAKVCRAR